MADVQVATIENAIKQGDSKKRKAITILGGVQGDVPKKRANTNKPKRSNRPTARLIAKKLGLKPVPRLNKLVDAKSSFSLCQLLCIPVTSRVGVPVFKKMATEGVAQPQKPIITLHGTFYDYRALLLYLVGQLKCGKLNADEYSTCLDSLAKYFGFENSETQMPFWNNFNAVNAIGSCDRTLGLLAAIPIKNGLRDSEEVHNVLREWTEGSALKFQLSKILCAPKHKEILHGVDIDVQVKVSKPKTDRTKAITVHLWRTAGKIKGDESFPDQFDSIDQVLRELFAIDEESKVEHIEIQHHVYPQTGMHVIKRVLAKGESISKEMIDFAKDDYGVEINCASNDLCPEYFGSDSAIEILCVPRKEVTAARKRKEEAKKAKEDEEEVEKNVGHCY